MVRDLENGRWIHETPLRYYVGELATSQPYVDIRAGDQTDFASTPFLRPGRRTNAPAAVHDRLYQRPVLKQDINLGRLHRTAYGIDRKRCDQIFLEAMLVKSVPKWRARAYYLAVRTFGWRPWNKYRKRERDARNGR